VNHLIYRRIAPYRALLAAHARAGRGHGRGIRICVCRNTQIRKMKC